MKLPRVENAVFLHGRTRIPLISGEFHYWRNTAENWPAILASIRDMGLKVVSTYVPWNFHELSPGRYDFTGRTSAQRDLTGFLDLAAKEGFHLIVRPGPYIYAEWPFGGVPERAAQLHRLDPEFLKMSRNYIRAVSEVLVPRQITRGGKIILCQACNEPYPPIESFAEEMGCFGRPGIFKEFLRAKYGGDLAALNRRWRTRLASFDEACVHFHEPYVNVRKPLSQRLLPHPEYALRYADTMEFVGWYGTRIVEEVSRWLRESGIDVPIFANGWSPLYQDFTGLSNACDLVGMDVYPMPFIEGDRQTEDEWFYVSDILKAVAADVKHGNVWSAEFQSGIYPLQTIGYLPPDHFRFVALSQVARGLRGWNWYMLVTRDSWPDAPVDEWGRPGEFFATHRDIVAEAEAIEPWNLEEIFDASLFLYKPHRINSPGNFEEMVRMLEEADAAYDYYDPYSGREPGGRTLLYAGSDWIEREVEARLVDFVKAGGTLVCFSQFPSRDEFGEPLRHLTFASPLGARPVLLPVEVHYRGSSAVLEKGGHMGRKVNFFYYPDAGGEPVRLVTNAEAREQLVDIGARERKSFSIGSVRRLGQGRLVLIGSHPCAELLRLVLEREGGIASRCGEPGILTHLHRHRNGDRILFVINRQEHARRVTVQIDLKKAGLAAAARVRLTRGRSGKPENLRGRDLRALEVSVAGHSVAWFRLRPA